MTSVPPPPVFAARTDTRLSLRPVLTEAAAVLWLVTRIMWRGFVLLMKASVVVVSIVMAVFIAMVTSSGKHNIEPRRSVGAGNG